MAKPVKRRLKVFQAQFGFFDTVVAASSQAAALKAWGVRQNLFASGDARLTTDDAAVEAARAHPETPLRRAVGSNDPFQLEAASLPKAPEAAQTASPGRSRAAAKAPKPARIPPDRSALDAAEAMLKRIDDDRKAEEAALRREADALQARAGAAQAAYVDARKIATAEVVAARSAYRKSGSSD